MRPAFEQLLPPPGQSFRCFNRESLSITTRWHCHPEIELTYVQHGSGTRIVGDNLSSYGDSDLVLIGPDLPHTWQSDEFQGRKFDQHPAIVVQFRPDFLGEHLFDAPEFHAVRTMLEKSKRGLHFPPAFADHMGERLAVLVDSSPAARVIQLLDCLLELAEFPEATPLASVGYVTSSSLRSDSRTQRICNYIGDRFRDPNLTHQDLAEQAEMNASAFSRFFRESTGKTAMNYLAEMRVSLACRLLVDTEMSITDIYQYAGFNNTSNFNRQFRRFRDMSAREYRKRHREVSGIRSVSPIDANSFSSSVAHTTTP